MKKIFYVLFFVLFSSIFVSGELSVKLIENTDFCLIDCYAIIEVENIGLTDFSATADNFELYYILKENSKDLTDFEIQEEKETEYQVNVLDFENKEFCEMRNFSNICETRKIISGSHIENKIRKEFLKVRESDIIIKSGEKKRYKIYGKKKATLGENNVDWKIRVEDFNPDWAWWNSSWDFRYNLTINNSASISHDYELLGSNKKGINLSSTVCYSYPNSTRVVDVKNNLLLRHEWYNNSQDTIYVVYNKSLGANSINSKNISIYCDNSTQINRNSTIFAFRDDFEKNNMDKWKTYGAYVKCSITANYKVGRYAADCLNQYLEDNADFSLDSSSKPVYMSHYAYEAIDMAVDNDGTGSNVDALYFLTDSDAAAIECGCYDGVAWQVIANCNNAQWYLWNYEIEGSAYNTDVWINDTLYKDDFDCWRFETTPILTRKVIGAGAGDNSRYDEVFIAHTKFRVYTQPSTLTLTAVEQYTTTTTTTATTTTISNQSDADLIDFYYFDNTLNQPHTLCVSQWINGSNWRIDECFNIFINESVTIAGNSSSKWMLSVVDKRLEDSNNILNSNIVINGFAVLLIFGVSFLIIISMVIWKKILH